MARGRVPDRRVAWRGVSAGRLLGPEVAPAGASAGEDVPVPVLVVAGVSAAT